MRKARLIYESERACFMADHKSVSAQLTLGNFPTPLSNQTPPSRAAASQGDPPRALGLPRRRQAPAGPGSPTLPRPVQVGARVVRAQELEEERSKDSEDRGGR